MKICLCIAKSTFMHASLKCSGAYVADMPSTLGMGNVLINQKVLKYPRKFIKEFSQDTNHECNSFVILTTFKSTAHLCQANFGFA